LEEQHAAEKLRLETQKEEEYRTLKGDIEALKGVIVKRDHFKAMSDRELSRQFNNLASEIDNFSRVRWDNKRETTWPFPDRVFHKLENERRSKKYVIQNTFWVILYERIFCTPFRVLGTEGKLKERDWTEQYGQDLKSPAALAHCPKPTKDSEKWRYDTINDCLKTINQLGSEPNYKLKRSYEQCLNDTTEDISHELERVASMDNDKQTITDIVRKAAQLWLEVGQQRYRIFLLMSKSGTKPSRSGQAFVDIHREQELVVGPEVRRIGNAQGERLEKDELVPDCKGNFIVLYAG